MKRYTPDELAAVLAAHKMWCLGHETGRRADLRDADLRGADLQGADLRGADLRGLKIKQAAVFTGLYKYLVMPVIAEDGTEWVCLGCHFRTVADWDANFWNNNSEFPNAGDAASKDRWNAYQAALGWLQSRRDTPTLQEK